MTLFEFLSASAWTDIISSDSYEFCFLFVICLDDADSFYFLGSIIFTVSNIR